MLKLEDCAKGYTRDQDKAMPPEQTVERVKAVLKEKCEGVLAETDRVDTGRLGIPVFVSVCGPKAASIMPTRKQMGKGASPQQAEASALMELVERFSFFHFWEKADKFQVMSWSEAREKWPDSLIGIERILQSVDEEMPVERAEEVMELVEWRFGPAFNLATGQEEIVPLDWFKKLNEFNGSSAGNTTVESVFQGACELVERHVCSIVDKTRPELPTLDPKSFSDPVLLDLCSRFASNGVKLVLKDFSLGMPVPTVAALAYDPLTFPGMSEIVFTAGTAASPAKAAIRAVTEVAQLAGDFETGRVYEASGLPKFLSVDETAWLADGPLVDIGELPTVEDANMLMELNALVQGLSGKGYALYSVDIGHSDLGLPANYNFVPGFDFRERAATRSMGLFVGRMLAEEMAEPAAEIGLDILSGIYPGGYFIPFFKGLLALRQGDPAAAGRSFAESEQLQPGDSERALAAFYLAYSMSLEERWPEISVHLDRAIGLDPEVKEFFNLRGVSRFKDREYEKAAEDFKSALALDSGSASDLANLGLCYKFLGDRKEAVQCLGDALELDPGLEYAREHYLELSEK